MECKSSKQSILWLVFFLVFSFTLFTTSFLKADESWKEFESLSGRCKIDFPSAPQHVMQRIPIEGVRNPMTYDVYVSQGTNSIYFMVVAQYPLEVKMEQEMKGLESFINGILSHNKKNELLLADLIEIQGHKALDFLVKNEDRCFKGRVIVANNKLYLLAVECDEKDFLELSYTKFIGSFYFIK